jgi:F0F1-type ATP synthase assembly protein I
VTDPGDRERRERADDQKLSSLAEGYQKAAPYLAASTNLAAAVGLGTWAGHWADGRLGFQGPWLTLTGALLGMLGGFISFFHIVLATDKKNRKP